MTHYPDAKESDLLDATYAAYPSRQYWQYPDRVPNGYYLVLGDEVGGLPQELLDRFPARQVRVPMIPDPSARSLNLSTCAGIAVYEALRQINTTQPLGISG